LRRELDGAFRDLYVEKYTEALTPPGVSMIEVRGILAYALGDANQMEDFDESFGPDGSYVATATYSNGERIVSTYDGYQGAYSQTREMLQPDGTYRATADVLIPIAEDEATGTVSLLIEGREVTLNASLDADGDIHLDAIASISDTYRFGRGSGQDRVVEEAGTPAADVDRVLLGPGISADDLWLRRAGDDLVLHILGTQDQLTLADWYASGTGRVERFDFSDGRALLESRVQALVQAMAAFAPPPVGQSVLAPPAGATLLPPIATQWT
jgi:hypothetical protein